MLNNNNNNNNKHQIIYRHKLFIMVRKAELYMWEYLVLKDYMEAEHDTVEPFIQPG